MNKSTSMLLIATVAGIMVAGTLAVVLPSVAFAQTATGGNGGIGGAGGAGGVAGNGGTNNGGAFNLGFSQRANGGDANGGHGGNANGGDAAACHDRCGARA
jgi:hypothetical protein